MLYNTFMLQVEYKQVGKCGESIVRRMHGCVSVVSTIDERTMLRGQETDDKNNAEVARKWW
jgi:hypothetical protein